MSKAQKLSQLSDVTGIPKVTAGSPTAAAAGTDYLAPPSGTALLKANSGGALANATAGSEYLAPPSGTALLKANSGGALAAVVSGTDIKTVGGVTLLGSGDLPIPATPGNTQYMYSTFGIF